MRVSRSRRIAATWIAIAVLAAGAAAAPESDVEAAESHASASAATRAFPAVVAILALDTGRQNHGAGVLVRAEGFVLTALHVVKGAAAIAVSTADGDEFPAKIHAIDEATDIALLRLIAPGRTFPTATLGGDERIRPGETVLAISNPFGIGTSVSRGVLSAKDRRGVVKENVAALLQTDAAINPGSSGGALVDLHGDVIGLITAILTRSGGHQGIGFAVPARELERALPFLLDRRPVARPWLGLRVAPDHAREAGGLAVTAVVPGGPADRAGVRPGDTLLSVQGLPLRRVGDLTRLIDRADEATSWEAALLRDGDRVDVSLCPEFRPPTVSITKP
jgi:serine protease DegQ